MITADLKARTPNSIGHRTLAAGESLCRIEFASAEDLQFMVSHLRWSAYEFDVLTAKAADPAPAPSPASDAAPVADEVAEAIADEEKKKPGFISRLLGR